LVLLHDIPEAPETGYSVPPYKWCYCISDQATTESLHDLSSLLFANCLTIWRYSPYHRLLLKESLNKWVLNKLVRCKWKMHEQPEYEVKKDETKRWIFLIY
jgi:hypothetical protein